MRSSAFNFDIRVVCPGTPISRLELGMILPGGATADFGPGCVGPTGGGCSAVTLSDTVEEAESFVLYPPPVSGGRSDTLYFVLQGAAPERQLCPDPAFPNDTDVTLAQVAITGTSESPVLTDELLGEVGEDCNDPMAPGLCHGTAFSFDSVLGAPAPIQDIDDNALSSTQYALAVGSGDATVEITVRPRLGDTTGLDWDVNLRSTTDIVSAMLGFILPSGASALLGDMKLVDCPTVNVLGGTGMVGLTKCDPTPLLDDANLDSNVDAASTSQQTYSGISPPRGNDTLYVHFVGGGPGDTSEDVLVHVGSSGSTEVRLGTLRLAMGFEDEPPVLTLEGAHLFGEDIFDRVDIASLGAEDALLTGTGSSGEDYDADNVANDVDNCRYAWNPDKADSGGYGTVVPNDRGDACECGDGDGDGVVGTQMDGMVTVPTDPDVPELQEILAGDDTIVDGDEKVARCSVNGDTTCDILDLVILQASVDAGDFEDVKPVCLRAISSEAPSDD
jgi:hypothetical protein